jgi:hypothetical protein
MLSKRYGDAYGKLIRLLTSILGVLIVAGSVVYGVRIESMYFVAPFIVFGIAVGLFGFMFGTMLSAQGEMMRAIVDVAVNTSTYSNAEKNQILASAAD